MVIYKITNKLNGKSYIGQTIQKVEERWYKHLSDTKKLDYPLYRAMRKYGKNNFKFEVITKAENMNDLNNKEREFISLYKSTNRNFGYNILEGGNRYKMPQEVKDKISRGVMGKKKHYNISNKERSRIARENGLTWSNTPFFTISDLKGIVLYSGCILSDCSRQLKIPVSTIHKWVREKRKSRNYKVYIKKENNDG